MQKEKRSNSEQKIKIRKSQKIKSERSSRETFTTFDHVLKLIEKEALRMPDPKSLLLGFLFFIQSK
jgi:hypothetical protein